MRYDLLIRNAQVVQEAVAPADIGAVDGKVVEIAPQLAGDAKQTIDATGLHVLPGLIDVHVHFNDPGRAHWEGIPTGSAALMAGGGTTFFDMPLNASPPTLDGQGFDQKLAAANGRSRADFALWGGLTPNNLDHLEELADRGVVGFKAFMSGSGIDDFGRADELTLYRGMIKAQQRNLPVAVHAESEIFTSLLTKEAVAAGKFSRTDYLDSRPVLAEVAAIQRAILLAEETGCRLHVVHVSSARGVAMVAEAAARGIDVTCETCPHYLILTRDDVERLGAPAKCAPPLRTAAENTALWQDLADGRINLVASDHSPAPPQMKESPDFFKVWGGIAGVQSTLPILLSGGLPLPKVAQLTAVTPASRFGIAGKGGIAVGNDADFAVVDLNRSFELRPEDLLDRHKLSPYVGRTFRGVVRQTILRGRVVFADGKLVGEPAGRLLTPART